jgi:hypothetical protein
LRVIDARSDTEIDRVPLLSAPPSNPKRSRLAKLMFSPDGRYLVATSLRRRQRHRGAGVLLRHRRAQ